MQQYGVQSTSMCSLMAIIYISNIRYTGYALIHTITNTGICQYRDTTESPSSSTMYIEHTSLLLPFWHLPGESWQFSF